MSETLELKSSTVIRRTDDTLAAPINDDLVLLNIPNGVFYGFDDISRRVWEMIDEPRSVEHICDQLQCEFEVDRETCEHDILELVETLVEANLVESAAA